ncbi:uncharacterized protein LOC127073831 [Lathyrus oleraceus]|uniref:SHSP domain-containing protein n=1 Tax=Pisum sativum TaxID=3888 RepID=A0A9D4X907_PEA|nr:uncharacterized protein LOC127073831 [Pisum sativum]KAI5416803.1 hypothetical protein KIW84_041709 [Pisum sativum]
MANAGGTPRLRVTRAGARTALFEEIVPNSGWSEDSTSHYLLVDLPEFKKEDVKLQVDSSGRIVVKGERQASEQKRVRFHLSFPAPSDSEVDKIAGKFDGGILYVTLPKQIVQANKESDNEVAENGSVERAEENDSHITNANDEGRDFNQHVGHAHEGRDFNQHVGHTHDEGRDFNQHVGHTHDEARDFNQHVAHDEGKDFNQHVRYAHEEHKEERNENVHMGDFSGEVIRKWDQETMLRSAMDVLWKNKEIVLTAVIGFSFGMYVSSKFQFSEAL